MMTDEKLKELWGENLYNYCYAQSVQIVGYPSYSIMVMIAIGKIKDALGGTLINTLNV